MAPYRDIRKKRSYQNNYLKRRRAEYFANKLCAICLNRPAQELDHIEPALKIDHRVWSWSEKRREEELRKCQVLCKPCHYVKTAATRKKAGCGTWVNYNHRKCRCVLCVEAARRYRQQLKLNRRALEVSSSEAFNP